MSSTNLTHPVKLSWDTAIADAEREIEKAKRRIESLKRSLKTFRERKAAGDSFPGVDSSTQT